MTDIVESCAAAWNRMAMERELAEASKKLVAQSTEIERLRAALRYALENGVCTQYWGDDDDCGTHGCCGEVSYKPHDAECWTVKARAALEERT